MQEQGIFFEPIKSKHLDKRQNFVSLFFHQKCAIEFDIDDESAINDIEKIDP